MEDEIQRVERDSGVGLTFCHSRPFVSSFGHRISDGYSAASSNVMKFEEARPSGTKQYSKQSVFKANWASVKLVTGSLMARLTCLPISKVSDSGC